MEPLTNQMWIPRSSPNLESKHSPPPSPSPLPAPPPPPLPPPSLPLLCFLGFYMDLSPSQMDLQVDTSQCKFAKPDLAYRLVKGVQTDSQVGSRVAQSRKFHAYHWLMRFYNNRLLVINLCRLALGGQTVKNCVYLHPNLSLTKVYASPRKSTQVHASGWPNEMQVERKSKTCVYLWVCYRSVLDSPVQTNGFLVILRGGREIFLNNYPQSIEL